MKRFWTTFRSVDEHYVINYGSHKEIVWRERAIADEMFLRNFDRSRITLVNGGFGTGPRTVIWKIPKGAEYPKP